MALFDIGKSYKTRCDEVVTITDKTPDGAYLIGSVEGAAYARQWRAVDGRVGNGPPDSQYDLIPGEV
jgi:hypothetical protein